MAFPTGTFYDAYQDAINWLLNALGNAQKYPLLNAHALPRLHNFLQGLNEEWVEKRARNHEIPTLVLSVTHS